MAGARGAANQTSNMCGLPHRLRWIVLFVCVLDCWSCCHVPAAHSPEFLLTTRSHDVVKFVDLPSSFEWRNASGINLVTPVRNQQLPKLCGSCWAHAATSALSDRLMVRTRGQGVAALLAPQVLLDLHNFPPYAGSCNGGDHHLAYEFIRLYGIADESCSPYQGVDTSTWGEDQSPSARMCRVCSWDGTCRFTESGPRYGIAEHGKVKGVEQMMAEIYKRGPIACAIHAKGTVFNSYTGVPEIITDDIKYNTTTHVIVLIGWGEGNDGTPYWVGKNSYGTAWGLNGFFKLRRGHDELAIESHSCAWAVPFKRLSKSDVDSTSSTQSPTKAQLDVIIM